MNETTHTVTKRDNDCNIQTRITIGITSEKTVTKNIGNKALRKYSDNERFTKVRSIQTRANKATQNTIS